MPTILTEGKLIRTNLNPDQGWSQDLKYIITDGTSGKAETPMIKKANELDRSFGFAETKN